MSCLNDTAPSLAPAGPFRTPEGRQRAGIGHAEVCCPGRAHRGSVTDQHSSYGLILPLAINKLPEVLRINRIFKNSNTHKVC